MVDGLDRGKRRLHILLGLILRKRCVVPGQVLLLERLRIDGLLVDLGHLEVGRRVHGGKLGAGLDVDDLGALVAVVGFVARNDEQGDVNKNFHDAKRKEGAAVGTAVTFAEFVARLVAILIVVIRNTPDAMEDDGSEVSEPDQQVEGDDGAGSDATVAATDADADALGNVPDESQAGRRTELDNGKKIIDGYAGGNANDDEREDDREDAQSELGGPHAPRGGEDGAHGLALRREWLILLIHGLVLRDGLLLALLVQRSLLLLWRRGRGFLHDGQSREGDGNRAMSTATKDRRDGIKKTMDECE